MASNPTPNASTTTAPDFSNFNWVPGKNARYDAACISRGRDGRRYVGLRGYDKKNGAQGYISAEMTYGGLVELRRAVDAELAAMGQQTLPPATATTPVVAHAGAVA